MTDEAKGYSTERDLGLVTNPHPYTDAPDPTSGSPQNSAGASGGYSWNPTMGTSPLAPAGGIAAAGAGGAAPIPDQSHQQQQQHHYHHHPDMYAPNAPAAAAAAASTQVSDAPSPPNPQHAYPAYNTTPTAPGAAPSQRESTVSPVRPRSEADWDDDERRLEAEMAEIDRMRQMRAESRAAEERLNNARAV
jgi:hypothetical protein